MNNFNQEQWGNIIDALALLIGWQNLQENRAQSAYNDVHKANDEQAALLLAEISARFDEQNAMLAKQTEMLETILSVMTKCHDCMYRSKRDNRCIVYGHIVADNAFCPCSKMKEVANGG